MLDSCTMGILLEFIIYSYSIALYSYVYVLYGIDCKYHYCNVCLGKGVGGAQLSSALPSLAGASASTLTTSFQFESLRQRELFCALVTRMKLLHRSHNELDALSLFAGTWNQSTQPLPQFADLNLASWLRSQGAPHPTARVCFYLTDRVVRVSQSPSAASR